MKIEIRHAHPDDATAMAALLQPIVEAGLTAIPSISERQQREYMLGFPADGVFLVALEQETGSLLGMQGVVPIENGIGEIGSFVDMQRQGQGVGSMLFQAMQPQLREKGYREIKAVIQKANNGAGRFYYTQGFRDFTPQGDAIVACRTIE